MNKLVKGLGIAFFIFVVAFTACNNGNDSTSTHTHEWGEWTVTTPATCETAGEETRTCKTNPAHTETRAIPALGHDWGNWTETTAATYLTEGEETRTCKHDATHKETRPIPRLTYTAASISALETWLSSQTANTAETAYKIALKIDNEADFTNLKTTLNNATDKYVYLDLDGSTITTIPDVAFYNNITLAGITIPNNIISIGNNAFRGCTSLTAINVDNANTAYSSENGVLYDKAKTKLIAYPSVTGAFTIPASITVIGFGAFADCASLTSVNIPTSVTGIETGAFFKTGITSVTIPDSVTTIGSSAFGYCTSLTSVTFQGTIISTEFSTNAFSKMGDLWDKFYATDATNGTSGTYTRTGADNDGYNGTWTKQ